MIFHFDEFWREAIALEREPSSKPILLDVRSESEFNNDGYWRAINLPILNNQERHDVGVTFKQRGSAAAIELGHQLVSGDIKSERISAWIGAVESGCRYLTCWRGGLRSRTAEEWLKSLGIEVRRLEGGTKLFRRRCLESLSSSKPDDIDFVVYGRTGAGKTRLLKRLNGSIHFLDLEGLANHRGSSFGYRIHEEQPSQINFENRLALQLACAREDSSRLLVLEGESRLIGRSVIPLQFHEWMKRAPRVYLSASMESRVQNLLEEYVLEPFASGVSPGELLEFYDLALARIQRRLGGAKYQEIRAQLKAAFSASEWDLHRDWIENLLVSYYDRLYDFNHQGGASRFLVEGRADEIQEFFEEKAFGNFKEESQGVAGR